MAAILRHVTIHGALCHGLPRFQVCLMLVTAQVLGHCGEQVSEAAARPAAYMTGDGRVQLMAPAPCALPDVRRPFASVTATAMPLDAKWPSDCGWMQHPGHAVHGSGYHWRDACQRRVMPRIRLPRAAPSPRLCLRQA